MKNTRRPPQQIEPFAIGDVVYLKSGSPPLIVTDVLTDSVSVAWIDAATRHQTSFPVVCLQSTPLI